VPQKLRFTVPEVVIADCTDKETRRNSPEPEHASDNEFSETSSNVEIALTFAKRSETLVPRRQTLHSVLNTLTPNTMQTAQ
jgi:hypothetical protein